MKESFYDRRRPILNAKKILQQLIITVGMFVLSQLTPNIVVLAIVLGWTKQQVVFSTTFLTILILVNIGVVIWWAKKLNFLTFDWTFLTKRNLFLIIAVFLVSRVLVTLFAFLQLIITGTGTNNDQQLTNVFQHAPLLLIFLTLAVAAPIMEEVVFRGCLIGMLFKNHTTAGLIISSILFGAVHTIGDWISFPIYFIMGLALGFIYIKTKRLETSMSVHFLNNLIGTIAIMYGIT